MLTIHTNCCQVYIHDNVTNVRRAKRELRWTNARGEPRSMAMAFVCCWALSEPR